MAHSHAEDVVLNSLVFTGTIDSGDRIKLHVADGLNRDLVYVPGKGWREYVTRVVNGVKQSGYTYQTVIPAGTAFWYDRRGKDDADRRFTVWRWFEEDIHLVRSAVAKGVLNEIQRGRLDQPCLAGSTDRCDIGWCVEDDFDIGLNGLGKDEVDGGLNDLGDGTGDEFGCRIGFLLFQSREREDVLCQRVETSRLVLQDFLQIAFGRKACEAILGVHDQIAEMAAKISEYLKSPRPTFDLAVVQTESRNLHDLVRTSRQRQLNRIGPDDPTSPIRVLVALRMSGKEFHIPYEWICTYNGKAKVQTLSKKKVYKDYPTSSASRPTGEVCFEKWCEKTSTTLVGSR